MKKIELAKIIKDNNENIFKNMPEKKVQRIVSSVIDEIGKQLDQVNNEEKIVIAGFGVFRKKNREKDGKTIEIIRFRRAGKHSKS